MAFIEWTDELSVGVDIFDNDHRELVAIANRLHDGITMGYQQNVLIPTLYDLLKYTLYHFSREEGFMLQYSYPDYEAHREEHERLLKSVQDYYDQAKSGQNSITLSLMGFLRDWLINHIMGSDRDYREFFNGKI